MELSGFSGPPPTHGGNLIWAAAIAGCHPDELLDFSASINPLGPPKSAIAAIMEGIKTLMRYPDPNYQELRRAIATFHDIAPEWILPGNGAAELLTWAARDAASSQRVYLLVPAFADYWRAFRAVSCEPIPLSIIPTDRDRGQIAIDMIGNFPPWQDIDPHGSAIIINNPHNPTGKLWSIDPQSLAKFSLAIIDEAFMDFVDPAIGEGQKSLIPVIEKFPNIVIIRSLTKFYSLPGLRLGYAIAHPERLKVWQKWRDPWSVNNLAASAGIACLQDKEFADKTHAWLTTAKQYFFAELAKIDNLTPYPSAANFLLVKGDRSLLPLQTQLLQDDRILIRDCQSFPELGNTFCRLAVRTIPENDRAIAALRQSISSSGDF
jgi:L-threonine-O-3-phosphate decarboxylase